MADRIVVMKDGVVTAEIASPTTAKPTEVDVIKHMM